MFTTKKYTRPFLVKSVRSVNINNFTNVNTFINALSPRAGRRSAQVSAIRQAVRAHGFSLEGAFTNLASDNKRLLLALLKNA